MEDINEESLLSTALDNYILDNYEVALNQLNNILTKFNTSASKSDYLLYRAVCNLKLGKFEEASKDLDQIKSDANYKKNYNYYLTLGKTLYYLCKFKESKDALNEGIELDKDKSSLFTPWLNKVEEELKE